MCVRLVFVCVSATHGASLYCLCRCLRSRRVARGVGLVRPCCPPMPWLSTSSRSPWPTESPPRRPSSSSMQVSPANSTLTQRRVTETPTTSAAPVSAHAAPPPATRTVRTPALLLSLSLGLSRSLSLALSFQLLSSFCSV
jgi:hypothetical protein